MLAKHMRDLQDLEIGKKLHVNLMVGMPGGQLSDEKISAFLGLAIDTQAIKVRIFRPKDGIQNHSKLFYWSKNGEPHSAWIGSPNYSLLAFGLKEESDAREEVLAPVPATKVAAYLENIFAQAAELHDDITRAIPIEIEATEESEIGAPSFVLPSELDRAEYAVCPMVSTKTGSVHNAGAGLNWGQPTASRRRSDVNAAYLPLPADQRSIFPEIGVNFEVICPDGQVLIMSRSQSDGKAISCPASGESFGLYLRSVLQIPLNTLITDEHLKSFGSDCVVFEKLSEGRFAIHVYPGLDFQDVRARQALENRHAPASRNENDSFAVSNIRWNEDELLLAAELVYRNNWQQLDDRDPRVSNLSELLRIPFFYPRGEQPENHRSPASIALKTLNIADTHPNNPGGRSNGSRLDAPALEEFIRSPRKALKRADKIRRQIRSYKT